MPTPLEIYRARLAERQAVAAARERSHVALGNAKVAVFMLVLIYWAVTVQGNPNTVLIGAAVTAFVALSVWHELVMRARARAQAAVAFYTDGIARIEDRWVGTGKVDKRVEVVDIAPTLAKMLGVAAPPASQGKVLPLP